MKFGKSAKEAAEEPSRGGGGGGFMKYCKAGDNTIRILDEQDKWIYYWEHFNPGGFAFPCTNDETTCPGCTSDIEKMKKVSRKIAFNAFDGQYTNVWKVPKTVADKLENRSNRIGTITDRDYIITMTKTANSTDYDVEGQSPEPFDFEACKPFMGDPEQYLADAYEDAWGDDAKVRETRVRAQDSDQAAQVRAKIQRAQPAEPEPEKVMSEAELRKMDVFDLEKLCKEEGFGEIPPGTDTSDEIVDWMLTKV